MKSINPDLDNPKISLRIDTESAEAVALTLTAPDLAGMCGDKERVGQLMYYLGWKSAEIARALATPASTVRSWVKNGCWKEKPRYERMHDAVEMRYLQLLYKPKKSNADYKELDAIGRQLERWVKIERYTTGGNEVDLNPKLGKRYEGIKVTKARQAAEKNHFEPEHIEALRNRLLDMMFPHQRIWYERYLYLRRNLTNPDLKIIPARIRALLKSRQIGATYYFGNEGLLDAAEFGDNQIFASASKRQAHEFLSVIKAAGDDIGVEITGSDKAILSNGAELIFVGTNSRTAQSYHGHVYVDEYFWIPRFAEFNKVAGAMATHKNWRKTYLSTPSTITHDAYALWSGKQYNQHRAPKDQIKIDIDDAKALLAGRVDGDGIWRQRTTLKQAIDMGFTLSDYEMLERENSPVDFAQLYLCEFADDRYSAFPAEMLMRAQVDTLEQWQDVKLYTERPCAGRGVWVGYDPATGALGGDKARAVVVEPPPMPGGKFRVIEVVELFGDFVQQAGQLKTLTGRYHVAAMAIDTTGIGASVINQVQNFYPGAVEIKNNIEKKTTAVTAAQYLFKAGRIEYDPADKELTSGLMGIKRQMTASGNAMTFASDRNADGHCDTGWALITALTFYQPNRDESLGARQGRIAMG